MALKWSAGLTSTVYPERAALRAVLSCCAEGPLAARNCESYAIDDRIVRAREENRTPDLLITSEMLCRLSYPGTAQDCTSNPPEHTLFKQMGIIPIFQIPTTTDPREEVHAHAQF